MVVICPRCKIRLKVDETRLLPQGSRFKCQKCSTVLVVKKPSLQAKRTLDSRKILVAHSNPEINGKIKSILTEQNYKVITSAEGIDAMVKALGESPYLAILEVVLPKIYGFELCKRLKSRAETKNMKFILITSVYDKTKYRREPTSLYGADEYIEEHNLSAELIKKVNSLRGLPVEETERMIQPPLEKTEPQKVEQIEIPEEKFEPALKEEPLIEKKSFDEDIEKAKRLSRTIINDIYLYNASKVDESIRNNNFFTVFSTELNEGKKLYENRIPPEIRDKGDFFTEVIENFINSKKTTLEL